MPLNICNFEKVNLAIKNGICLYWPRSCHAPPYFHWAVQGEHSVLGTGVNTNIQIPHTPSRGGAPPPKKTVFLGKPTPGFL